MVIPLAENNEPNGILSANSQNGFTCLIYQLVVIVLLDTTGDTTGDTLYFLALVKHATVISDLTL